jgi:hypothetical protein
MTRCLHCGKPRRSAKGLKKVYRNAYEQDEFCTSVCAKAYYGVVNAGDSVGVGGHIGYRKPRVA